MKQASLSRTEAGVLQIAMNKIKQHTELRHRLIGFGHLAGMVSEFSLLYKPWLEFTTTLI